MLTGHARTGWEGEGVSECGLGALSWCASGVLRSSYRLNNRQKYESLKKWTETLNNFKHTIRPHCAQRYIRFWGLILWEKRTGSSADLYADCSDNTSVW